MLFEQHEDSRKIRKAHADVLRRMTRRERDALPRYFENPKYIVRGKSGGGEVHRWVQVADVVYCGDLTFGECIHDLREADRVLVQHRDGSNSWYDAHDLEVVHHNIIGMGRDDTENLLNKCLLKVRSIEEIEFAASVMNQRTRETILGMPAQTPLNCELLTELHAQIFGDLFPWGGQYRRRGDIVVGRGAFETPAPQVVPLLMQEFDACLQDVHATLDKELHPNQCRYWMKLARIYFELCKIHPFRDGNGRVSRLLMTLLLIQTMDKPALLNWDSLSRSTHRTDRAFETARVYNNLRPLAQLIYRVFRTAAVEIYEKPPKCLFGGRRKVR